MALGIDAQRDIIISGQTDDLIFVAMEGREGVRTAIEAKLGLVAFGENKAGLIADIKAKVQQYVNADFNGKVKLLEFTDTVIELQ